MIRRYVTRSSEYWGYGLDPETYLARTVHEPDPKPRESGLLDAGGNKLYSTVEMSPIGFVKFKKGV